jgi:hypothetical protein
MPTHARNLPLKKSDGATARPSATRLGSNRSIDKIVPSLSQELLQSPGQPLDPEIRSGVEARFNHDFSQVRIHTDARAAESADDLQANAYTVGQDVVFAAGKYNPSTSAGTQLLTHELTHVLQQGNAPAVRPGQSLPMSDPYDSGEREAASLAEMSQQSGTQQLNPATRLSTPVLQRQPSSLSDLPQGERNAIQVNAIEVTVPTSEMDQYFPSAANNQRVSTRLSPAAAQVVFATAIPQNLRTGLESVSGYLANQTNALPLNTTVNVALNLAAYGGANSVYRFTRVAHTENRRTTNYMLIEEVGAAPAASAAATANAGPFTVGGQNFTLSSGWSDANFAVVRQALSMLPPASLTAAAGLTFRYNSGVGAGAEAGEYDRANDTVVLFSNAFPTSSLRFGTSSMGVRNVLHEIGHALDLRPLEQAWGQFNQAGQTARAQRTFLGTRSLSGSRYVAPTTPGGDFSSDVNINAARDGDFRNAVLQDGARRVPGGRTIDLGGGVQVPGALSGGATPYSDVNYEEMFAEAFALYTSDPALFQKLRPNTYQYFARRYPRTP